jgi:phosphatidylethanolamine/phosphatidyl-N-methylethanolamine N-methyltransferase
MPDDHEPAATRSTAADAQALETQRTYDRIAPLYDLLDGIYERSWKRKLRAELFRHARGRVLDVGVGTGCNMPFYPPDSEVVGIDMSERMLERARQRARELGREISLRPMNLLSLDFPDASFDTVAVTFVLLCLPDELQEPALRELRRVTRPDGLVLLLDYRMSRKPGLRLWMRCLSPWLKWAFAGRFDATTDRYLESTGLEVLERRSFMGDGITMTILERAGAAARRRPAA